MVKIIALSEVQFLLFLTHTQVERGNILCSSRHLCCHMFPITSWSFQETWSFYSHETLEKPQGTGKNPYHHNLMQYDLAKYPKVCVSHLFHNFKLCYPPAKNCQLNFSALSNCNPQNFPPPKIQSTPIPISARLLKNILEYPHSLLLLHQTSPHFNMQIKFYLSWKLIEFILCFFFFPFIFF